MIIEQYKSADSDGIHNVWAKCIKVQDGGSLFYLVSLKTCKIIYIYYIEKESKKGEDLKDAIESLSYKYSQSKIRILYFKEDRCYKNKKIITILPSHMATPFVRGKDEQYNLLLITTLSSQIQNVCEYLSSEKPRQQSIEESVELYNSKVEEGDIWRILKYSIKSLPGLKGYNILRRQKVNRQESEDNKEYKKKIETDPITLKLLDFTLRSIPKQNFVSTRKRCAFLIMFTTGLRVSELLQFTVQKMWELINTTRTQLLRRHRQEEYILEICQHSQHLLKEHREDFNILTKYKQDNDFFFTTQKTLHKPINRCSFDDELNTVLEKTSASFDRKQKLKTHSFRIKMIQDLLSVGELETVKNTVGHTDIKSTYIYKKGKYNGQTTGEKSEEQKQKDYIEQLSVIRRKIDYS